ncbi:carbonate dehydratase [bacterium]|nr:carbonate dehydratase [bacterium]
MRELKQLFDNNRQWAENRAAQDASYFPRLASEQNPDYLWIGCADSRVPANEIVGLDPGELFVHRNVANLVVHTDFNALSVIQYAVEYLKVKHIIVCGHLGCGGVKAAMGKAQVGLADNWLRHIRDVYAAHARELDKLAETARYHRLVELNVLHQVSNVCHTTIIQNAWNRGEKLSVHGWVYNLEDGLLRDLDCCISGPDQVPDPYLTTE